MPFSKEEFDIDPDENGTFMVYTKNFRKLLCDGLIDTFRAYGKIATICHMGNKGVQIRYLNKSSALQCYYDLCDNPDFKVDLPHKFKKPENADLFLGNDLKDEARITFPKSYSHEQRENNKLNSTVRYVCRKRKIIRSAAFKCFMVALSSLNQYRSVNIYHESLILEVKRRGINLDFKTGFEDEIEHNSHENEIPQLILAQDLYYFHISKPTNAVDVLICCLPPWYEQIDAYKLVLSLVPDDLLRIDWYRMYPGSKECSYPYGIVYLKTRRAAETLRYGADELVIDSHKITVCLMDNVENILLDVKSNV